MRRGSGYRKSNKPKRQRTAAHNMADEFEIEKHQKELEKLLKRLNEDGTPKKPLTESAILGLCRGAIRNSWSFCDTKLAYLNMKTVPDTDTTSRRRWKVQCEICNEWFGKNDVAVDHVVGGHSLRSPDDLFEFYDNIINVSFDDLQVLCHTDHDRKTVCDLHGYTWEESGIFKQVTALETLLKNEKARKEFLLGKGFEESEISNKDKRRSAFWKFIVENPNFKI
ncbi:hypothetical protein KUA24_129 [Vibrio phage HNL01]|nr:hypothetical protein KUA24_129 [Vibrio phage HNL01]